MGSVPDAGQKAVATFGLMDREDSDGVPLGRKRAAKPGKNAGVMLANWRQHSPKKKPACAGSFLTNQQVIGGGGGN